MKTTLYILLLIMSVTTGVRAQTIRKVAGIYDSLGYTGNGGPAVNAQAGSPTGVAVDSMGNLYFSDNTYNVVRKVSLNGTITTVVGSTGVSGFAGDSGLATTAKLNTPRGIAIDALGNLYVADHGNHVIRKVTTDGIIHTIAGTPGLYGFGSSGDGGLAVNAHIGSPADVAVDQYGNLFIADGDQHIRKVNTGGIISTVATSDSFSGTAGITVDPAGNIYFADANNYIVRKLSTTGTVSVFAGIIGSAGATGDGGLATNARLNIPIGVYYDPISHCVYIADQNNNRIRMVSSSGIISTVAGTSGSGLPGDGGLAAAAHLNAPVHICINASGLFIADGGNNVVREVNDTAVLHIAAIPGNDICTGTSVTFKASVTNAVIGTHYQWQWNGINAGNDTSVYVNSSLINGDIISCTVSFPTATDLLTAPDTIVMAVHPLIVPHVNITNDTNDICATMPVTFTATDTNGGTMPTYQWQVNGSDKMIGSTYTYQPVNGDIVTCFLTSDATCATPDTVTSNAVVMQVNADVIMHLAVTSVSGSSISKNQVVSFVAESTNEGLTPGYQWFINRVPVPGATSTIFSTGNLNDNDTVTCVLTGSLFCTLPLSDTSEAAVISVYNEGVTQTTATLNNLLIKPNPGKGVFSVVGTVSPVAAGDIIIQVADILGQVVYDSKVIPVQGKINEQVTLDNTLPNGLYLLHIYSVAASTVLHFAIQR